MSPPLLCWWADSSVLSVQLLIFWVVRFWGGGMLGCSSISQPHVSKPFNVFGLFFSLECWCSVYMRHFFVFFVPSESILCVLHMLVENKICLLKKKLIYLVIVILFILFYTYIMMCCYFNKHKNIWIVIFIDWYKKHV